MASGSESTEMNVPDEGKQDEDEKDISNIQSHYLRSPSPSSFSVLSDSRFSMISGSDAASIFLEPIHLSSAIAAKQIINEELPSRALRTESIPESMLESAEQLMVEDLYNRVKDMIDDRSPYNTPCVLDIQRAMVQDRLEAPINVADEVWPNIFIAEKSVAVNKGRLKRMGITHILNAAHGTGVYTGEAFYTGMNIKYMGIEVDDFVDSDIAEHFRSTAEFLDEALLTHKGKVLVVSMMGVSRSAILVASYLMIFQHMTIMEALTAIRKKRAINPNEGFLRQLREFNENLLEERDDDDETLSQCSVIDARTRARIFGEDVPDEDDDLTDEGEERSMVGVKAHSIMMEQEGDASSVMSSVASSAAAAALQSGLIGAQNGLYSSSQGQNNVEAEFQLPLEEGESEGRQDEDGLDSMIHEWQRRNEKYQSEEWWEAQLNSDEEEGDLPPSGTGKGEDGDVESVTSEEVRAVKERVKRRNRRTPSEAMSTSSCSSYTELWKQCLREIEEQAAARYRKKEADEGSESNATEGEGVKKKIDEEMESIFSDSSSMYNFCQKNKDKMTALERWRIKRIQFGWNKKDREDGDGSSVGNDGGENDEGAKAPSLQDVNLTAYQSWKLRQQRRYGEENPDELLDMSRGEDSATARRRQKREEILERARKNLEESQSMCGWENESCVSGGTIPLSAFWAGAGVTGSASVANDDNMSMISGRSSNISSVSQARSVRSLHSAPPPGAAPSVPPILPVPTLPGPGGEPMVNLASIQNWIANVVTETIKQKQSEMSLPPPSRAGSEVSFGGAASILSSRAQDDDKRSVLSGTSYSSALLSGRGRTESVLSGGLSTASGTSLGSKRNKITSTSVPLYSLFQDEVDMNKLDLMEKEIKCDMRDKMSVYEKKKILEDNKRSTLFKKKKQKDGEEEEEEDKNKLEEEFLEVNKKKAGKQKKTFGLSGCLNLNTDMEKDKNVSVDDWLKSVRPPTKKSASPLNVDGTEELEDPYDDIDASASEFGYPGRETLYTADEDEEEEHRLGSRYQSRLRSSNTSRGSHLHQSELDAELNGSEFRYSRAGRSYAERDESEAAEVMRTFAGSSTAEPREGRRWQAEGAEEGDDDVAAFIAQTRQRVRARAYAEAESDEVLAAWREQQEAKTLKRSEP